MTIAMAVALAAACAPPPSSTAEETAPPPPTTPAATPATVPQTTSPATITPPPLVPRASTTTAVPAPVPGVGVCPGWSLLAERSVAGSALIESSGLAGGQLNPGVWWSHNDSGDTPRLFALEGDGRVLSTVTVTGADAWDWEDIDIGRGPGGAPYLWVADLGDNAKARQGTIGYQLYRIAEPALGTQVPALLTLPAQRIDIVYPDGPHNVEATILDPVTGDYFIITKEATSIVFRIPAASLVPGTVVTPTKVAELLLDDPDSNQDRPVAADISADGSMIVVKTMDKTWFWHRAPGQTVTAVLSGPTACAPVALGSGEALAFNASGGQVATLAEGANKPLIRWQRTTG